MNRLVFVRCKKTYSGKPQALDLVLRYFTKNELIQSNHNIFIGDLKIKINRRSYFDVIVPFMIFINKKIEQQNPGFKAFNIIRQPWVGNQVRTSIMKNNNLIIEEDEDCFFFKIENGIE